jgi:uncharacterized HAD superfamily protein/orotate phosphoribosyltransferase
MSVSSYQYLNYRGLNDLEQALHRISLTLPADVGLVVGVPRSGLLAASILALQLNLPLTDVEGYIAGRQLMTGRRTARTAPGGGGQPRAVVVDDSILTGGQFEKTRAAIEAAGRDGVLHAAAFVTRESSGMVDAFGEIVPPPRIFAWNLLHHRELMARACIDIDGVLCLDPTEEENDDGPRYGAFLATARPLFVPSVPVKYVVTSRLERYREETARWLERHHVQYSELVMLDADAETRRRTGLHAHHKARFYTRSGTDLFIESDYGQAVEIAALSGRQVFALEHREMVYPSAGRALAAAPGAFARSVGQAPPLQALATTAKRRVKRAAGPRLTGLGKRALGRG